MTMLNAGLPTGSVYYVQTQSYTASATIPVPPKCIRIEALLVGGGGSAGGNNASTSNAIPNTGGGAGSVGSSTSGTRTAGNGGSGIVIVRYAI